MNIPLALFLFMSCCLEMSNALPVASQNHDRQRRDQRRVPYSVVQVDGGTTATAIRGQTVTRTVTQSFDSTRTVTASPIAIDTTVVLTIAEASITAASPLRSSISVVNPSQLIDTVWVSMGPGALSVSPSATTSPLSITSTVQATYHPIITTTPLPSVPSISSIVVTTITLRTTVEQQPESTSKSYDNGQWHTIYRSWNATSATSISGVLLPTGYRR